MKQLGRWKKDGAGLPCFVYEASLPYHARLLNGKSVKLPEDPWFLLGNYRMTTFAHVSGEYELISGQRSWARLNQGKKRNSGVNGAFITIDGERKGLTGIGSLAADSETCQRVFGCGFAAYSYKIGSVTVCRNLSVKPSADPRDGASGILLTVITENQGSKTVQCEYEESMGVCFAEIRHQTQLEEELPLRYQYCYQEVPDGKAAKVCISAYSEDPLMITGRREMAVFDAFPPEVFMQVMKGTVTVSGAPNLLSAKGRFALNPGETVEIQLVIGFSFGEGISTQDAIFKEMLSGKGMDGNNGAFSEEWRKVLPAFESEEDETLRQELRWHAYCLEAMATYGEYYDETKIPQGTIYDYDWGNHASARDNFQHGLPLIYYNQALAKSLLRYMLKRTTPFGEIRLIEYANGCADNERYFTSDQQLYFLLLLSEYLRVTKDYAFLEETIQPYPVLEMAQMSVALMIQRCFVFLRDVVGIGQHGLVRLLNSDWNDAVYYIEKVPYNNVFFTGESHMNTAMAIAILQSLIPQLKEAAKALPALADSLERLCASMTLYRERILSAFLEDGEGRTFPRRMYFNGKAYGEDNMFLEPQGFTLQIAEISPEAKRQLYAELQKRLYEGEVLGAREQEKPEFEDPEFDKGSRENGGFWWALNGPVIIGVSKFDRKEARRLLENMTFRHFSESFPQYWSSYWSAADQVESSLIPEEGLPDQSLEYANIPVYCAHPHAWILYVHQVISENN